MTSAAAAEEQGRDSASSGSREFFRELESFSRFLDFTETKNYKPVPADWSVVLTDVRGSTQAIELGHYKTVNMIGAASIAAIANTLKPLEVPIVFGGDGATVLVPNSVLNEVSAALRAVRRQAKDEFAHELRIGIVPVSELTAEKAKIEVAKFRLSEGPPLAFLRGPGLDLAEKWVKEDRFALGEGEEAPIDQVLAGLSCRWAPLSNTRGLILTLLVKAKGGKGEKVLRKAAEFIDRIVDFSSSETHPIKPQRLRPERLRQSVKVEIGLTRKKEKGWKHWLQWIPALKEIVIVHLCRHYGKPGNRVKRYFEDHPLHSDFCKYDDTLRMVIDCTHVMSNKIFEYLESEFKKGELYYGYHLSNSALMTCFVQGIDRGQHIHFVDGHDGGYALAAKMMKHQVKGVPVGSDDE